MRKPGKPTEHWLSLLLVLVGSTSRIRFPRQSGPPAAHMLIPGWEVLGCGLFQCASCGVAKVICDHVCGCCRDFSHGRFVSPKEWLTTYQLQGTIERAVRNWKPLRFCSAYSTKEFMTGTSTTGR